ncbi:MAG: CHASE4 domain-containing protein [Anaerolineae bacterium]|nr:PAS domain S-box protein [Anaerolineae bacterium]MDW8068146.1 CHASE4 domain-containing protein [Anaerolineae bacterium]
MSLRLKTAVLVAVVMAGLIMVLYLFFSATLTRQFSQLEHQEVEEETRRVVTALLNELEDLDTRAEDWAPWDETDQFIEDGNPEYISHNLTDSVFENLRLNLMLFVHSSGRIVYGKAFDLGTGQQVPLPDAVHLLVDEKILHHTDRRRGRTGIMLMPEGPLLLSSWPIVTSLYEGPIRGTLVMGRYLSPTEVWRLSDQVGVPFSVYRLDQPGIPGDVQLARSALTDELSVLVRPLDDGTVAGYALFRDIHGDPALILRIQLPRTIYRQGENAIRFYFYSLLTIGILFGALSMLLLERFAVSRLIRMSAEVDAIGVSGDPSRRLRVRGKDELSRLGEAINRMLEAIQSAQEARAESEARYRMIVEQASEGIALLDGQTGRFLEANAAFQRMLGYSEEEFHQRSLSEILGAGTDPIVEEIGQVLETGTHFLGELACQRKDGTPITVEVAVNRIYHQGREVLCLLVRDITERKRMEQYLIQTERMTAMGQMAATLAHEMNNPLHSIWTMLELITEFPVSAEEKEQYLQAIRREVWRLMTLTRQVLDFARPPQWEETPVNLTETLRYALGLAERQLREHDIQVALRIPDDLPVVVGSQDQLAQVFLNLILNAVDAMPKGGRLEIQAIVHNQQVILTFADTGPGIPPEIMKHLFEPFITTKKGGDGSGIGRFPEHHPATWGHHLRGHCSSGRSRIHHYPAGAEVNSRVLAVSRGEKAVL